MNTAANVLNTLLDVFLTVTGYTTMAICAIFLVLIVIVVFVDAKKFITNRISSKKDRTNHE